ncbi:hypothetical protein FOMPIDRAFT_1052253 [Fomitopsis schrenkii]|uniref:Uncharacterized protein n=1 Tax=Fomitopsis schrenkii TaxID=2126942 RepID=S8FH31_FOMSC|nr:hypothetical protein FOMPIDRAFT_1052253 [Fomitopsis schrenkii]
MKLRLVPLQKAMILIMQYTHLTDSKAAALNVKRVVPVDRGSKQSPTLSLKPSRFRVGVVSE